MISEDLIKKHSGQYDCEVVTRLKLERLGISYFKSNFYSSPNFTSFEFRVI